MTEEQRSEQRLPVRFEVKLSAGQEREGTLVDISRRGARVSARGARLRPETEVRLLVQRRMGGEIAINGRVRWSNADSFAVTFSELDVAAQRWLDSILEEDGTAVR
ncbi:MAG: PilZ domain-containing protein [Myxococcota bacterium]